MSDDFYFGIAVGIFGFVAFNLVCLWIALEIVRGVDS